MHSFVFRVCLLLAWFLVATDSRSLKGRTSDQGNSAVHQSDIFKAFETKFLDMMGLKSKPRVRRDTVMPQYMLDLYNSLVDDTNYVTTNLVFKDFATTANTVRAIYHTDVRNDRDDHGGISNSSKKHVALNITAVPAHEHLVKAEFRIYRNASGDLDMHHHPRHIINVYQILQPGVAGKKSVKRLLDSRVIDATSDAGWDSYDILKAVHDWRERPAENHGLEVDIMSENGNPIDISRLRFEKPEELEERMWPHHRPLLAVYTHDPKTHYHEKRVRRSSFHNKPSRLGLCKRRELIVTFRQLNWDKWLITPTEYRAYMCQGDCIYPLADHMNGTNHAIVQTLVHNVKRFKDTVPAACCVPTEFDSLRMLYLDEHELPLLKTYKEMIVTACGCR